MKTARVAMIVLCFSVSMCAQYVRSQNTSVHKPVPARPAVETPAAPEHPSLDLTLAELERITTATSSDLNDLQIDKWRTGWRAAWLRGNEHREEAQQMADSLRRNLKEAVPGLISEVQNSHGSVSSAFKLYNDLNVVVESLDSLIAATRSYGRKGESGPLANDDAALNHLRQDISSYIQSTAATMEPRTRVPTPIAPGTSGASVKKVVVDDDVPEAKPARKRTASVSH
jgi:hypothetical protein